MNDAIANLWVFGSCLRNETPNDIDLLWVYDANRLNAQQAISFVTRQISLFQFLLRTPIHNTVLSTIEEERFNFISSCRAKHLYRFVDETTIIELDAIIQIDTLRKRRGLIGIFNLGLIKGMICQHMEH